MTDIISQPVLRRPLALALLAFVITPAAAQTVAPPIPIDGAAVAIAKQALAAANAPTIVKTTIVGTDIAGTPPVTDPANTLPSTPVQVVATNPSSTGYLALKYGADGKGVVNYWAKTRGTTADSFAAVQAGDRIVTDYWQAGTGGQTGHAGAIQVAVDNAAFTAGEVAARWMLMTGTGIHVSQAGARYPNRYGSMPAVIANSYQQVLFPGGANPAAAPIGSNFGGWVVIGAGAAAPGYGALKFLTGGATLLATPEPGAFEVDAQARPYFTGVDGVRRGIALTESTAPAVTALSGAGATAAIDANGNAGVIRVTTVTSGSAGGFFRVTYAHPYAAASYPVLTAANAAAADLLRNSYVDATATGFTLNVTGNIAPGSYAITFNAPGK